MRTGTVLISAVVILLVGGFALNNLVPFNPEYLKQAKGQRLRDNVKEWLIKARPAGYGYTTSTDASCLFATNLTLNGRTVQSVMKLDSSLLRKRGYLLATEAQEVFWIAARGKASAVK